MPKKNRDSERAATTELFDQAEVEIAEEIPPERYQDIARGVVSSNFLKILKGLAEKSVAGSLSHTKYLFEIGGVKEDLERLGQDAEPSFADLLHEEVQRQRADEEARRREADEKVAALQARTETNAVCGADCGAKPQ